MYFWISNDRRIRTPSVSFVDLPGEIDYEQCIEKLGEKSGLMFYNVHMELLHAYRIWNTFGKAFTRGRPVYVDNDDVKNIIPLEEIDIWSRALLTQAFVLIDTQSKASSILKFEITESNSNEIWQNGIKPGSLKSIQDDISNLKTKGKGLETLRHRFLVHKQTPYPDANLSIPQTKEPFEMGKLADYLEIASNILNTIAEDHSIQKTDYMLYPNQYLSKRRIP